MTSKTQQDGYDAIVNELKRCAAGTGGWVSLTERRAAAAGTTRKSLTIVAHVLGLAIERHGATMAVNRAQAVRSSL